MGALTEEMRRLVDRMHLGYVASEGPDGAPNLSPKGTLAVWDDDHLVFADLASPRTVENLRRRPAYEANVVDPFSRRGFRFRGTARVIDPGPDLEPFLVFFARFGVVRAHERVRTAVLLAVERARPVVSPAYDTGATEESLRRHWLDYYSGRGREAPESLDLE